MAAVSTLQIMLDGVLGEPVENIRRRVRGIRCAITPPSKATSWSPAVTFSPQSQTTRAPEGWYYKLQLGPLEHKLPPIVSARWRRITFILTTGDRFMQAMEINDLFEQECPAGQLYVRLKELGIPIERDWWVDEEGIADVVDLALPVGDGWLPVGFGDRPGPAGGLRFSAEVRPDTCLREIQTRLRAS